MERKNYSLEHVNADIKEVFEIYYNLTFGFYDLEKITDKTIIDLSKLVKNEVFRKAGKFYDLFEEIETVAKNIQELEHKAKDSKELSYEEGWTEELKDLFYKAIEKIGELMFIYGVNYGQNM